MTTHQLSGVIAAIATAVDETGAPDCARSTALARFLLANGCDGLNVLGTTGEATSFSLEERKRVMTAYRDAGLPMERLMVGTGAASVADAIALTRHAAELGFAGAPGRPVTRRRLMPRSRSASCSMASSSCPA
jgi:4-hydroxy-tetrahydrodipicolinate synthase